MKLLLNYLNNLKISKKIILGYIFLVLFPMLIFLFVTYASLINIIQNQFFNNTNQLLAQTNQSITSRFESMMSVAKILIADEQFKACCDRISNESNYTINEQIRDYRTMISIFKNYQFINGISNIKFYVNSKFYFTQETINFDDLASKEGRALFEKITDVANDNYYSINDNYFISGNTEPTRSLSISFLVSNPKNMTQPVGVIKINTNYDEILEIMKRSTKISDGCIFYIKNNDSYISTNESLLENFLKNKTNYFNSESEIGKSGLILGVSVPNADFNRKANLQISGLIIILIMTSFVFFAIIYIVSTYTTKRIYLIKSHMQKVVEGDLKYSIQDTGKDEIGELARYFGFLVSNINDLLDKKSKQDNLIKETEIRAVKAELSAFESQIKPHFIYNTLDVISWKAVEYHLPELEGMVYALSKFFKYSLKNEGMLVQISKEAVHVRIYIDIHNMKNIDKVDCNIHLNNVQDYCLPKITLQPIVENALIHGILRKESKKGTINIWGVEREDVIEIMVEDDGVGMNEKQLSLINNIKMKTSGIGISNVRERLRIYFGEDYGVTYKSTEGVGTIATIIIPKITQSKIDHGFVGFHTN